MSKANKRIRRQLEKIYGKGCMFERANIEARIEEIRRNKNIKGFYKQ